jgi:MoaA/NifB/PqqE/SkfB family radical SAM enzyme
MKMELFQRLVDENPNLQKLHLQGLGEPMMHPRFFEMVSYAKSKGITVTTNTNMTLLNPKRAEACVLSGLDEIHISIDGAKAETYERIRKRGKFAKVLRDIHLLIEARQRLKTETPRMSLVMVIMRQNLEELPDIVRLAHDLCMEKVFVQHLSHDFSEGTLPEQYKPMRDYVQEQTLFEVDEEIIQKYFNEARQVAQELGVELRLPRTRMRIHPPGTPGPQRCDWPWMGAYIAYDGHAMPCCMISTPDRLNFGKVDGHDLGSIWNGEPYRAFRSALNSDQPPELCQACSIYKGTF